MTRLVPVLRKIWIYPCDMQNNSQDNAEFRRYLRRKVGYDYYFFHTESGCTEISDIPSWERIADTVHLHVPSPGRRGVGCQTCERIGGGEFDSIRTSLTR